MGVSGDPGAVDSIQLMAEKKKRKKKKRKSPEAAAEEELRAKARELWDDPDRELDEYDLELARLQSEMDHEEEAAEAARAAEARKRKEAAQRRAEQEAAEAAAAGDDEEAASAPSPDDEADPEASDVASEPPGDPVAEGKKALEDGARGAAGEVATEALRSGATVGDAALVVAKRRLPSLPSKTKVRNLALAVGATGIGMWLLWGLVAPLFAWAWWFTKWGIVGGLGYGAFWAYGALPNAKDDGAEDSAEED